MAGRDIEIETNLTAGVLRRMAAKGDIRGTARRMLAIANELDGFIVRSATLMFAPLSKTARHRSGRTA